MFIELTNHATMRKIFINLDNVNVIGKDSNGLTILEYDGNTGTVVIERYEEVKALIEKEVAAERGY